MTMTAGKKCLHATAVTNTGYKLEWARFNRQAVADFLKWQVAKL